MTAMEVFERCRAADEDIRRIEADIERYRDAATNVSPRLDSTGGGGCSVEKDRVGTLVAEVDRLQRAVQQRIARKCAEIDASCKLIDRLPPTVRSVMHRYYVKGESLNEVAKRMKYSYGYVRKMKSDGVRMAMEIDKEDVAAALPDWYLADSMAS
ncbi:MAG: hypothetical protein GXY67_10640 [Clostridiales bacterium]|nr:hypothetical protein [Clostridiales bacterium]